MILTPVQDKFWEEFEEANSWLVSAQRHLEICIFDRRTGLNGEWQREGDSLLDTVGDPLGIDVGHHNIHVKAGHDARVDQESVHSEAVRPCEAAEGGWWPGHADRRDRDQGEPHLGEGRGGVQRQGHRHHRHCGLGAQQFTLRVPGKTDVYNVHEGLM